MTRINLDAGDMSLIRYALRQTGAREESHRDLIPMADQLTSVESGTLTDDRVTTVTVPEAAWEALIDLKRQVHTLVAVEEARRRAHTLDRYDDAQTAEGRLYDALDKVREEWQFAERATQGIRQDQVIDCEVAES
jgi:DNA polymerase II large subunit